MLRGCWVAFTILLVSKSVLGQDYTYEQYTNNNPNKNLHLTNDYLNYDLIYEISEMYDQDQLIRTYLLAARSNEDKLQEDSLKLEMNKVDSLNRIRLKNIIAKYSYPTRYNAGYVVDKIGLFIAHSEEHENEVFLEKYYDLALKGDVDWSLPERIEGNLLVRFKKDGYRFLKLLRLDGSGNIAFVNKNYFEISVLAKGLRDNKTVNIELYTTSNLTESAEKRKKLLVELVRFLIRKDISPQRISINTTDIIQDKYYKGVPLFAYKLSIIE